MLTSYEIPVDTFKRLKVNVNCDFFCLYMYRMCPYMFFSFYVHTLVSGSNLASHMVGSLKKGSKQSMSLPSTAYNTLPAHVHQMRSTTSSPRVISGQNISSGNSGGTGHGSSHGKKPYHKRSPSSDSGTGSNTPVSSYHSGKVHHTVFLHGVYYYQILLFLKVHIKL